MRPRPPTSLLPTLSFSPPRSASSLPPSTQPDRHTHLDTPRCALTQTDLNRGGPREGFPRMGPRGQAMEGGAPRNLGLLGCNSCSSQCGSHLSAPQVRSARTLQARPRRSLRSRPRPESTCSPLPPSAFTPHLSDTSSAPPPVPSPSHARLPLHSFPSRSFLPSSQQFPQHAVRGFLSVFALVFAQATKRHAFKWLLWHVLFAFYPSCQGLPSPPRHSSSPASFQQHPPWICHLRPASLDTSIIQEAGRPASPPPAA